MLGQGVRLHPVFVISDGGGDNLLWVWEWVNQSINQSKSVSVKVAPGFHSRQCSCLQRLHHGILRADRATQEARQSNCVVHPLNFQNKTPSAGCDDEINTIWGAQRYQAGMTLLFLNVPRGV